MISPEQTIARTAASRLTEEHGQDFPQRVEARLQGQNRSRSFSVEVAIAAASLLVSAATLAWTIYRDLKKDGAKPAAPVLERRVMLRLEEEGRGFDPQTHGSIVRRVVEVTLEQGES